MIKQFKIIYTLVVLAFVTSCQKVIELELNEADTFIVIEGEVNKDSLVHTIVITESKKFNSNNDFSNVSGAIVTISDDQNNLEILTETSTGVYKTNSFLGQEGRTYTLSVLVNGKEYIATSVMPSQVILEQVLFISDEFGGDGGKSAVPFRYDPEGVQNNYKFDVSVSRFEKNNGWEKDSAIIIQNDDFADGVYTQQPIFGTLGAFKAKDTCRVSMMCIDKNVYKYFFSLSQNGPGGAATPANPVSNFSNGALGYFSAQTKQLFEIVVPE